MRFVILSLIFGLLFSGCLPQSQRAGIEIYSNTSAQVFINNKEAGITPYKNYSLKPGILNLKLVTPTEEWSRQLKLENNASTIVNHLFATTDHSSGGYIMYLEKIASGQKAGLLISGTPNLLSINLDGEIVGLSPWRNDNMEEGDKSLILSFPAHQSQNVYLKTKKGYRVIVESELAKEIYQPKETVTPSPPPGSLPSSPKTVRIKATETGWLRVRSGPSSQAAEVTKVTSGQTYQLLTFEKDWTLIKINDQLTGWVSSKYVDTN